MNTQKDSPFDIVTFVVDFLKEIDGSLVFNLFFILGHPGAASRDDRSYSKLLPLTFYRPD